MQNYKIVIEWQDRTNGPMQLQNTTTHGSSIRRAINSSLLEFFTNKARRKERADAHACLQVKAWRVPKPTAAR